MLFSKIQKKLFLILVLSMVLLFCLSAVSANENETTDIAEVSNDTTIDKAAQEVDYKYESITAEDDTNSSTALTSGEELKDPGLNLKVIRNGMLISFNEENVTGVVLYYPNDNITKGEFFYYNGTPFLFDLNGWSPDEQVISVQYLGNEVYANAYNFDVITVERNNPELKVTVKDGKITITLIEDFAPGDVMVRIPGENFGRSYLWMGDPIVIDMSKFIPKTYIVHVSSYEDGYYSGSTVDVKVIIKKGTPKITAKAKTFKLTTKTKKYAIILKDAKGKAIKSVKAYLKVGGKTYSAITNSNGKATFKITKLNKKGSFKAGITFKGNKYYNKASKNVYIRVKA